MEFTQVAVKETCLVLEANMEASISNTEGMAMVMETMEASKVGMAVPLQGNMESHRDFAQA